MGFSRHTLFMAVAFCLHCYNNLAYRFIDSYMPQYTQNHIGLSTMEIGVLFSAFSCAIFLLSPFWGSFCNKFGYRTSIVLGLVVESCVLLCMPLTMELSHLAFFFTLACMRGLQGAGSAATQTGCYSLIAAESSSEESGGAGGGMGGIEAAGGLGNMLGPVLSGVLFTSLGYWSPPALFGVLGISCLYMVVCVLPSKQQLVDEVDAAFIERYTPVPSIRQSNFEPLPESMRSSRSLSSLSISVRAYAGADVMSEAGADGERKISIFMLLRIPSVLYSSLVAVIALASMSFLDATLEPAFARQHELTQTGVGACFALSSLMQLFFCPIAGKLSDNYPTKLPMLTGLALMAVSLLFLGPSPLTSWAPNLAFQLPALALLGCGASLAVIPTFVDSMLAARHLGSSSQPVIAGLSAAMFSLGEVVGPMLGSLLVQVGSFEWCCTLAAAGLATVLVIGLLGVATNIIPYNPAKQQVQQTREDRMTRDGLSIEVPDSNHEPYIKQPIKQPIKQSIKQSNTESDSDRSSDSSTDEYLSSDDPPPYDHSVKQEEYSDNIHFISPSDQTDAFEAEQKGPSFSIKIGKRAQYEQIS